MPKKTTDADATIVQGDAPPSARVPLDRRIVVSAAVAFIDDQGLPGLSMRALGNVLGVEAMALYRYVPGREDLLDAVVERVLDDLDNDDDVLEKPVHGWQDFLQRMAHGIRRVALAHPKIFPLVASRPPEAPWLRPPLRSLRWVEIFLDGMTSEGFSDEEATAAYRGFSSFLLGHLLLEVAALGADLGPLDVLEDDEDSPSLRDYPHVARMREALSEDQSAVEFDESLENLLDRLTLLKFSRTPTPK
jgi:AcrR family transcriptional regulator